VRRRRGGLGRRAPAAALALLALLALAGGLARAEPSQEGNLIVSLDGGISPRKLPRSDPAPVAVHIAGSLRTADGAPLPRLRRVEVALGGRGILDTRGLPICRYAELVAASPEVAMENCGDSFVGAGRIDVKVLIPGQREFVFHASLRAFNTRLKNGRRAFWLHAFGEHPPISLALPFVVHRRDGAFGTSLVADIPDRLGPWPHVARFRMTLGRRFAYRGRPHSYLSADCPLPRRFTAGLFPFARATYTFDDRSSVSATIVRGCRVRGD
jgi:hypothetical protein